MDGVYLFSKMHFTESVYMAGAVMPVLYALVATMITFLLTSFGACSVFFVRKNICKAAINAGVVGRMKQHGNVKSDEKSKEK